MAERYFLDTNVLMYSFDPDEPAKRDIAKDLVDVALRDRSGAISYQVVQECLHLMLRKFKTRIRPDDAQVLLTRILMPICRVMPSESLYSDAFEIASQTGWSFYDSLIVSAAAASECDILYTEDLQHNRTIRGVKIRNPFD